MKGRISVTVQNNRVQYKFTLNRNITILRGNSATGKTTLIDMVGAYENDHDIGITVNSEKTCRTLNGPDWKERLKRIKDSIVFIDEGNKFLKTDEFANAVKNSDNYYVIAVRDSLPNLPYSVEEVYGIVNKTKGYGQIRRLYSGFKNLYTPSAHFSDFNIVIAEDSNSGYSFFKDAFGKRGIRCVSARGKSNIVSEIMKTPRDTRILVIADGAAFGPEMENVLKAGYLRKVEIFLPESFEWLVLKSGLIDGKEVQNILDSPSDYIESREYFSWERFFNALLVERTRDSYLAYNKKKLNPAYLGEHESSAVLSGIPDSLTL